MAICVLRQFTVGLQLGMILQSWFPAGWLSGCFLHHFFILFVPPLLLIFTTPSLNPRTNLPLTKPLNTPLEGREAFFFLFSLLSRKSFVLSGYLSLSRLFSVHTLEKNNKKKTINESWCYLAPSSGRLGNDVVQDAQKKSFGYSGGRTWDL